MDIQIIKKDGTVHNLIDHGCIALSIDVNSIVMEENKRSISGRSGFIDYGADYRSRIIKIPILFKAASLHNYASRRDALNGILVDTDSYFIRELRKMKRKQYKFADTDQAAQYESGDEDMFVNGKQILVRLTSAIEWQQTDDGLHGKAILEYETTELPFFETTYRTPFLHDNRMDKDVQTFGLSDGINTANMDYKFTTNNFTVFNAGNVAINPLEMDFNIIVKDVNNSTYFVIKNETTGDEYTYYGAISGRDLIIDNGLTMVGGINRQADANTEYITLATGDNVFTITGGTFSEIIFDMKFYYK